MPNQGYEGTPLQYVHANTWQKKIQQCGASISPDYHHPPKNVRRKISLVQDGKMGVIGSSLQLEAWQEAPLIRAGQCGGRLKRNENTGTHLAYSRYKEKSKDSQCRKPIPVNVPQAFCALIWRRVKVLVHPGCISTSLAAATRDERHVACPVVVAHAQANWRPLRLRRDHPLRHD